MLELISQERYREKATPVDVGSYHNHGTPFDIAVAAGTVPGCFLRLLRSRSTRPERTVENS